MTAVQVVIASDLDQTLIFSPRAAARGPQRPAQVVEVLDGQDISLLSDVTRDGLVELDRRVAFVPVTTRTRAQYSRIGLPVRPRFAVVASGGVVLVDGEPDRDWSQVVASRLTGSPPAAVRDLLAAWAGQPWLLRVRDADDLFLVAAVEDLGPDDLAEVAEACTGHGWRAVHQGRKLYLLPGGLDKAAAVAHVVEQVGPGSLLYAAGDTLLDWAMLCAADRGWVPAGSELDRLQRTADHVTRTAEPGLAAAEQLVTDWLELTATCGPASSPSPTRTRGPGRPAHP